MELARLILREADVGEESILLLRHSTQDIDLLEREFYGDIDEYTVLRPSKSWALKARLSRDQWS